MAIDFLSVLIAIITLAISIFTFQIFEKRMKERILETDLSNLELYNIDEDIKNKYLFLFNELEIELNNIIIKNNIIIYKKSFEGIISKLLDFGLMDDRDYFILLDIYEMRNRIAHNSPVNEDQIRNNYFNLMYIKNRLAQIDYISKYNFENDTIGVNPKKMIVFEDEGQIIIKEGVGAKDSSKYVNITSPYGSSDYIKIKTNPKKRMMITYHIRQKKYGNKGVGAGLHFCEGGKEAIWMAISRRTLQYYDNKMHPIHNIDLNVWYKVNVELDCEKNNFRCYIDDQFICEGSFRSKVQYIDTIRSSAWIRQDEWSTDIDEISFDSINILTMYNTYIPR